MFLKRGYIYVLCEARLIGLYYDFFFKFNFSFIALSERCGDGKKKFCLLGNNKTPSDSFETEEIVMSFILQLTFLRSRMLIM